MRKSIFLSILYQTLPVLILTSIGEGFTGIFLGSMEKELKLLPGLLILVPAITDMRGNIGTAFGSRISTMLHVGFIKPVFRLSSLVKENILVSFTLSIGMAIFLGFIAHGFSLLLHIGSVGVFRLTLIAILSAFISSTILIPFVFFLTVLFFKKGIDPDNVIAPILPMFGDIVTILAILISARIVLRFLPHISSRFLPLIFLLSVLSMGMRTKRDRYSFSRIVRESIPILTICAILSAISGTILRSNEHLFFMFPGVLSLVPQVVEKGGSIGGVVGARMSTALYMGETKPFKLDKTLIGNLSGGSIVGIIISPLVGLFVFLLLKLFHMDSMSLPFMVMLSSISITILSISMSFLSVIISSLSFFFHLDPSNIVIPIITSLGDVAGVSFLIFVLSRMVSHL